MKNPGKGVGHGEEHSGWTSEATELCGVGTEGLTFQADSCMIYITLNIFCMVHAPVAKLVYAVDLGSASL